MINLKKYKIVLPNMVTSLSIVCGMASIFFTLESIVDNNAMYAVTAAWLILIGTAIDGLDGKVARITDTASEFGVQYDSIADIITFGVAPSVLSYGHIFYKFKKVNPTLDLASYIIPVLFILSGAIRLARFNVTATTEAKKGFVGLPIPTAAGALALFILFTEWLKNNGYFYSITDTTEMADKIFLRIYILYSILVSFLMVSNFHFPLVNTFFFDKIKKSPIKILTLLFLFVMLILGKKEIGFFGISVIYIFPGIIKGIICIISNSNKDTENSNDINSEIKGCE